jgi:hypothetical protein
MQDVLMGDAGPRLGAEGSREYDFHGHSNGDRERRMSRAGEMTPAAVGPSSGKSQCPMYSRPPTSNHTYS